MTTNNATAPTPALPGSGATASIPAGIWRSIMRSTIHQPPARLLLLLFTTIFFAHVVAMTVLPHGHHLAAGWETLAQSFLLVALSFPPVYLLSYRPLLREIGERRHAEASLRESEEKYRGLFEHLSDGAFLVDIQARRVVDTNRTAQSLLGRSREEILALNPETLAPLAEVLRQASGSNEEGAPIPDEEWARTDGSRVVVQTRLTLLTLEGRPFVLALARDVTEHYKFQAELTRAQRLDSLGALAGGIAHDLNNVLAPILMGTEMLLTEPLPKLVLDTLQFIADSAKRGAKLVQQVLTFARGAAGERAELQLQHLTRELVAMLAPTFPKGIRIQPQVSAGLWLVKGNATQIHQVLLNLCINARDAMPEGGVLTLMADNVQLSKTEAQGHPGAQPGPYVAMTIADTGTGISPETQAKMFDPFFTTKPLGQGTGLGLSTVLGIVKGHAGFVTVQSAPGHTRFTVFLPAVPAESLPAMAPTRADLPKGSGELVLVVDDEESIREMSRLVLEKHGYRVLTAGNGVEALALYERRLFEIRAALVDMMMPQMDGPATIAALRKIQPMLKIIAMSGGLYPAEHTLSTALDVSAFLPKPLTPDHLLGALYQALAATQSGAGGPRQSGRGLPGNGTGFRIADDSERANNVKRQRDGVVVSHAEGTLVG